MARGIVHIDWYKLSQLLGVPDDFHAVTAHVDPYRGNSLAITVEGPNIPEVAQGEVYPTVQLVDHFMTDENGVKWTRREIQTIQREPFGLMQYRDSTTATL
jgi:hypothetical protein